MYQGHGYKLVISGVKACKRWIVRELGKTTISRGDGYLLAAQWVVSVCQHPLQERITCPWLSFGAQIVHVLSQDMPAVIYDQRIGSLYLSKPLHAAGHTFQ